MVPWATSFGKVAQSSYNRDIQVPSLLLSSDPLVLPLAPLMLPPALSMLLSGSTYGTLRSQV